MAATVPLPGLSATSMCEEIATLYLRCKKAYYNGSTTLLTDAQFDDLEERLRARDPQHPYLALTGASVDGATVVLPCWMGSLDKLYPTDTGALERWRQRQHAAISKADPSAAADHACLATIKLDGVSGLIQLRRAAEGAHVGETVRIFSRGNGSHGSEWTANFEYLTSLHALVEQWHAGAASATTESASRCLTSATIRGEFIISKHNFSKYGADYASARAMVNGLLGSKTKKPKLMALVDFVAYELVEPAHIPASRQQTILATELGCHAVHTIVPPSSVKAAVESTSPPPLVSARSRSNAIDGLPGTVVSGRASLS
jgi:NAD-dependent DNA ligase